MEDVQDRADDVIFSSSEALTCNAASKSDDRLERSECPRSPPAVSVSCHQMSALATHTFYNYTDEHREATYPCDVGDKFVTELPDVHRLHKAYAGTPPERRFCRTSRCRPTLAS